MFSKIAQTGKSVVGTVRNTAGKAADAFPFEVGLRNEGSRGRIARRAIAAGAAAAVSTFIYEVTVRRKKKGRR